MLGLGFGLGAVASRNRATSVSSSQHSGGSDGKASDGATEDDTTVVEPEQGNVLLHIISNLRPGADLSRVILPTFILEPRSMLERITNFMCHPEMLLNIPDIDDPAERFVAVVKFYLSGWHIRPPGVKKPLNPILGEIFTCYWDLPDKTHAYYISEQTSHHPPKSSYFYMAPEHNIRVDGTLKPRSRFLGNSAASLMEGTAILSILNRGRQPHGEQYILTQPNMYARGILFGKMKYELGDHSFVRCPELGLVADIEFKTKGYWSGVYDAIGGTIKNEKTGEVLYELSGLWTHEMFIKNMKTGHREMFFNADKAKHSPPKVRPREDQEERESQRLWQPTIQAIKDRNHELATDEKTKIEEMQREEAAKRAADGVEWHPRLFRRIRGGPGGSDEGEEDLEWILNANIDGENHKRQCEQVKSVFPIVNGQRPDPRMEIPPRSSFAGSRVARSRSRSGTRKSTDDTSITKTQSLGEDLCAKPDPGPYDIPVLTPKKQQPVQQGHKHSYSVPFPEPQVWGRSPEAGHLVQKPIKGDSNAKGAMGDLMDFGQLDNNGNSDVKAKSKTTSVVPQEACGGGKKSKAKTKVLQGQKGGTVLVDLMGVGSGEEGGEDGGDGKENKKPEGALIDFGDELERELPSVSGR